MKQDKFKEVASRRANSILKSFRILGYCANKSSYEYTQKQVDEMFAALQKGLDESKARFLDKKDQGFTFSA